MTEDPSEVSRQNAQLQASTAQQALDFQKQMWNTAQENQKPFLQAGQNAVNTLNVGAQPGGQFSTTPQFKFDASKVDVTQDPGYAFRMQQGQNALTAGSAAAGNYGSGTLGVALQNYGQQLGSQEYSNAYNRAYTSAMDQYNAALQNQNTLYNRYAGLAGTGQVAANQLTSTGTATAAGMANTLQNSAALQAQYLQSGANYKANQLSSAGNQLGAIGNQLANYYMQQNALSNAQYGALYTDAGGSINNVDFESGGGWGDWSDGSSAGF